MDNKTMDTFSAIISMENGNKVAKIQWEKGKYIYIEEETGDIVWNDGRIYYEYMGLCNDWIIIEE